LNFIFTVNKLQVSHTPTPREHCSNQYESVKIYELIFSHHVSWTIVLSIYRSYTKVQ